MTTGTDKETIERYQDEDQESFRVRIEARMETLYQQDKTVPVAYLFPELMSKRLRIDIFPSASRVIHDDLTVQQSKVRTTCQPSRQID